jgi:DNA-binding PadR family transcriptional regulator
MSINDMSADDILRRGMTTDPETFLPLTETTLLILVALSTTPKHGYAILKEVSTLSDARITLSTGTLYGALERLLDQQWIERIEAEQNERGRKAYQLTNLGRDVLKAEMQRMEQVLRQARLRMAGATE